LSAALVDIASSRLLEAVPHGFFGREGGVSSGQVRGLQCGYGADDHAQDVSANRKIASEAIRPGGILVTPHQVHSPDVLTVDEPWDDDNRPTADALVTNRPGLVLGIVTADCAPILMVDQQANVIGAAHAGWRGAHGGVLENAVAEMEALGARRANMAAAIGPCIQLASYEVDQGFREQFEAEDSRFFAEGREGHWQFDLAAYCTTRLERAGLSHIESLGLDTYALEDRYFSYRRATHMGEKTYGRQISLIALA
jgi:YfiH family protein